MAIDKRGVRTFSDRERSAFSVDRVISKLANEAFHNRSCFESELLEDCARSAGFDFDSSRPQIPWALLTPRGKRDMTAAGASGSNYLVDSPVASAAQALAPWSVTARAGLTVLEGLTGNASIPRITTAQTAYWLTNEATNITEGQPTLGQLGITPKQVGAYVEVSRLLSMQSEVEGVLQQHLMAVVGKAIDTAVLQGSGGSGQPQGLIGTPGVGSATGTSLNVAGLADMEDDVATADGQSLQWITTPAVRKLLRARELATGSGAVWAADTVLGHPAHVTTTMPAATMICGDWSRCVLALWGGLTVEINPYAGFASGVRALRLLVSLDTGLLTPGAFSVAASIT